MTYTIKTRRLTLLFIALVSLAGSFAIIFSTRWYPWAYSDSTVYIVSARTFLEGGGLGFYAPSGTFERLVHHPPLYPLSLSACGLFGIDLLFAARWLNVTLFGATIFTIGAFTYRLLHSPWLAIILSVCILIMPPMVDVFSGAMSEPLFIFTAALGTFLLLLFLETNQRQYLILAASAAGLAFLTRYIGVFAIATGLIALLIFNPIAGKKRFANLVIFGATSILPNAVWWLYVYIHTASLGARQLNTGADIWNSSIELRQLLMELFWSWLPFSGNMVYSYDKSRNILIALFLIILVSLGFALWKQWKSRQAVRQYHPEFTYVTVWCLFSIAYLAFFAYSFIFTTPHPDLTRRTLLPLEFSLLIVLLSTAFLLLKVLHLPNWYNLVPITLMLVYTLANLPSSWDLVKTYYRNGGGFTSKNWHTSITLDILNSLPEDTPIITNKAAAVLLWTDRAAYDFCELSCDQPAGASYGDNPADEVQSIFREKKAALVLFYPYCVIARQPWNQNLLQELNDLTRGLDRLSYSCDGAIYFYP